jgi:hypothetical protein
MKVLDILDPEGRYILKERTFRPTAKITKSTLKNLYHLGMSKEEISRSIILDDNRFVWGDQANKVIPSKKFIPLYNEYTSGNLSKFDLFRELFSGVIYSESNHYALDQFYAERNFEPGNHQLMYLERFLVDLVNEYKILKNRNLDILPSLETIYNRKVNRILNKLKVSIVASKSKAPYFSNLAKIMGATIVDKFSADVILVDNMDESIDLMINYTELNNETKFLSAYWLIESYFLMCKAPEDLFSL